MKYVSKLKRNYFLSLILSCEGYVTIIYSCITYSCITICILLYLPVKMLTIAAITMVTIVTKSLIQTNEMENNLLMPVLLQTKKKLCDMDKLSPTLLLRVFVDDLSKPYYCKCVTYYYICSCFYCNIH